MNKNKGGITVESKSSYRQIIKGTSIFGGVQVINILISIVRVKFVALLLGPTGVGLMGLLNSPLETIRMLTGLGLGFSAVRDVANADAEGNPSRIADVIVTLRRWTWFTGLFGAAVVLLLSPLLSQWTFGNRDYTLAFILLSVTLIFYALTNGENAILQGKRKLSHLAKASVLGSLIGLFTSIPLYFWLGLGGIVPALIITSVTTFVLAWYFSRRVPIEKSDISLRQSYTLGLDMIRLGFVMSLTSLFSSFTSYALIAFINRTGGTDYVGFYNAGWSIVGQYTGLIFSALTVDYFPRLAAVTGDQEKMTALVNQQAEMVLIMIGPLLAWLIVMIPVLISLLYTADFMPVVNFVIWATLGLFLKALSWPVGFILLAKGDVKLFGFTEFFFLTFFLLGNVLGFYFLKLEGVGISLFVSYILGFSLTYYFTNKRYAFRYKLDILKIFAIYFSGIVACLLLSVFKEDIRFSLYISIAVCVILSLYSYQYMNQRLDIWAVLKEKLNR